MPIALKDPKEIGSDSLQSPHDPDVTYSGHKGKGYEVQVTETCHEENVTQIITYVEVTPSSGSDTFATIPVVDALTERNVEPKEIFADTAYGSGRNAFEAECRGTEVVSPVAGQVPRESQATEQEGTHQPALARSPPTLPLRVEKHGSPHSNTGHWSLMFPPAQHQHPTSFPTSAVRSPHTSGPLGGWLPSVLLRHAYGSSLPVPEGSRTG